MNPRLNNFGIEMGAGEPHPDLSRPSIGPERRKAIVAVLLTATAAWGFLLRSALEIPTWLPGLAMHAEPFYRDSDFWSEGVPLALVIGFPGLVAAAVLLAGNRWPLALLKGVLAAAFHALVLFGCVCLLWISNSNGASVVLWLLATLGLSWVWAPMLRYLLRWRTLRSV